MNRHVIILFIALLPLRSIAFALSHEEARKAFEGALEDENKTELLLDNLSGTLSDPVLIAYRAATEALMGKFSYLPWNKYCLLYTSPSPRDRTRSRMPSSA